MRGHGRTSLAARTRVHEFAAEAEQDPAMTAAPTHTTPPTDAPARSGTGSPGSSSLGIALWSATTLCLVAAGLVLWDARGAGVFTDVLAAAIAWCF